MWGDFMVSKSKTTVERHLILPPPRFSERYPEQLAGQLTHLIPSPGQRLERCRWGVENFWQVRA